MNGMTVSLATPSEVPVLLDMMEDFNRIEKIEWERGRGEEALRRLLGNRELGVVGTLVEAGVTIGYFVLTWGYDLEWNGRDAFLTELYLVAPARGHGKSRPFLARIEEIAKEHGVQALHLMVRPEQGAAHRLYQGAGFEVPPRLFMSKDLR